jgi:hypothetical protein
MCVPLRLPLSHSLSQVTHFCTFIILSDTYWYSYYWDDSDDGGGGGDYYDADDDNELNMNCVK